MYILQPGRGYFIHINLSCCAASRGTSCLALISTHEKNSNHLCSFSIALKNSYSKLPHSRRHTASDVSRVTPITLSQPFRRSVGVISRPSRPCSLINSAVPRPSLVSHHQRPYLPIKTELRTDLPGTRLARFGSTELVSRNRFLVPPLATQVI